MRQKTINHILQQTRDIYNRIASDFSQTRAFNWPGFEKLIGRVKPGIKILDLGCGNGRMADIFRNKAVSYLGIDNSEKLIDLARLRQAGHENFSFKVGDMTKLENLKESFDLILVIASLHHLPTQKLRTLFLKEVSRLLKKNGRAIISVWNLWSPKYWRYFFDYRTKVKNKVLNLNDVFIPWKTKGEWQMRYVHAFTAGEFKKILSLSGLRIEDIYYESKGEKAGMFSRGNLLAIVSKKW